MTSVRNKVALLALIVAALCPVLNVFAGSRRAARVLYVTQSKGFKHAVLPESERVMRELATKHGFSLTVSQEAERHVTRERLKDFDVLIFFTTGELPFSDEQKAALLDFIRKGKAFVGVHSATDTFYAWPEYGELIGGRFASHPWGEFEATVKVVDKKHPAARHLPETFKLTDEIYVFKEFKPGLVNVVMRLETGGLDMSRKGLEQVNARDFPLAWWRGYGKGRVFYTALGHRPEVWRDERFQLMLVGAVGWGSRSLR